MRTFAPTALVRTLSDRTRILIGKVFAATSVVLSLSGLAVLAILGRWDFLVETDAVYFGTLGVGFGALTWLMITPQARNGSVWALAWGSLFASMFTAGVAATVLLTRSSIDGLTYDVLSELSPSMLPMPAAIAIYFRFWAVVPALWLPLTFGLLLFPDGMAPTNRWKWVGWWSIGAITVGTVATAIAQNPWSTLPISSANDTLPGTVGSVIDTAFMLSGIGAFLAVASLIVRYRRSSGVTRSQIRWIAWGGGAFIAVLTIVPNFEQPGDTGLLSHILGVAAMSLLPLSYAIAITKYRLYGIDVVISKSVTYLGLVAVITALYAAVVVGPLLAIGRSDNGDPGLLLPIVATAVVAVLFEPIRSRMQRWANRLVYGKRSTPQEVLSQVTARLSQASAGNGTDDLATLLAEGTGADRAVVWLRTGDTLRPEGVWQADESAATVGPVPVDGLENDEFSDSRPVRHIADLFGALSITKPRNDPITPADRQLLTDVAAGAGLLLRNISLNRQLLERADEVRGSRRRLIAAQDAERRRLERDLHDGAQQQVVALKVKLGIAKTIAEREGADEIASLVAGLAEETQQAVDALRTVAHGIYPPLLESEGLEAALRAVERSSPIPLVIDAAGLTRYPRPVEQTMYFCVVETLERARMSGAGQVRLGLAARNGDLVMEVDLDDPSTEVDLTAVSDRIDAAGGTITIEDRPGVGTRVSSSMPTSELALDPA